MASRLGVIVVTVWTALAVAATGVAASLAPVSARGTSVEGAAWNADDTPIPEARVRLRNVDSGRIAAAAVADQAGQFTFANLESGTFLVELVSESGRVLAVGHVFTIAPGETVATFVRLGAKAPWYAGFFSNAAAAAAAAAASQGITALAPVARPVSRNK
jgi:hypothetical protein